MRNVGRAFFLWAGNQYPEHDYQGYIKDIRFSGICAEGCTTSWIGSEFNNAISDITMEDVKIRIKECLDAEPEKDPVAVPGIWGGQRRAGALVLRGIKRQKTIGLECQITNSEATALHWKNMDSFNLNGNEQPSDGVLKKV